MYIPNYFSRKLLAAIAAIKDQIDTYPLCSLNVEEFSKMKRVNRKDLQKCFKIKYGKRIHEYQKLKMMDTACAMLVEGNMSMKEIAVACGYSNQNNFSNAFKTVKHISPQMWQQINGTNGSTELGTVLP